MRLLRGVLLVRVFEWLLPFKSIAASLERLVVLYEEDLRGRGVIFRGEKGVDTISYMEDEDLAAIEARRQDYLRRGLRVQEEAEE